MPFQIVSNVATATRLLALSEVGAAGGAALATFTGLSGLESVLQAASARKAAAGRMYERRRMR